MSLLGLHQVLTGDHPLTLVAVLGGPAKSLSTDVCASLACRISGSSPPPACSSRIQARVPTLPTPTTLRATWVRLNCCSRYRRSVCSVRPYLSISSPICP